MPIFSSSSLSSETALFLEFANRSFRSGSYMSSDLVNRMQSMSGNADFESVPFGSRQFRS